MKFEIDGLMEFIRSLDDAQNNGLKGNMKLWLDAMGMEFLDIIQDEIIRTETVDTRRLLNSFGRGDHDNVWTLTDGGLTLEVGTNVNYASFANDGHHAVSLSLGKDRRWVPGYWSGSRFTYDPSSTTGMLIIQRWIAGSHYWDNAFAIFERTFQKSLERKLQEWLDVSF